jgi:murein DD-endopeptidase MepM/ murein hydrolase activator NlpD
MLLAGSTAIESLMARPADARAPWTETAGTARTAEAERVGARSTAAPTPRGALGVRPTLPIELAEPTPTPPTAAVVRFRPRNGWTDVSPWAPLSVRFTQPMDHLTTEAAFTAAVGDTPVTGSLRWAEGDTVLVLLPRSALPYGAAVRLAVGAGARSSTGAALASAAAISFEVASAPAPVTRAVASTAKPPASKTVAANGWRWPLIGPITQKFGETLTKYGFHQGIDIDGDTGDPVRAARGGRVTVAGRWDECGGLQVHIDHGDGLASWYRHLSRVDVRVGARVSVGAAIGAVGATGCAFGSHLHFAIRKGGTFVDPLRYLPPR